MVAELCWRTAWRQCDATRTVASSGLTWWQEFLTCTGSTTWSREAVSGFGANVPVSASGVIARSLFNEMKDAFNDGCISDKSVLDRVVCWGVSWRCEPRHALGEDVEVVACRRWAREARRCIEAETVSWSSKQSLVPWTTMSWLKLARLRCCSPLRKSSCDFRRCHALMLDTSCRSSHLVLPPRCTPSPQTATILSRKSRVWWVRWSRGWKRSRGRYPQGVLWQSWGHGVPSELLRSSMRDGSPRAARESGQLRLDVDEVPLDGRSQDEMGTPMTRLQGVREPQWQRPSRRQGRLSGCELRGLGVLISCRQVPSAASSPIASKSPGASGASGRPGSRWILLQVHSAQLQRLKWNQRMHTLAGLKEKQQGDLPHER